VPEAPLLGEQVWKLAAGYISPPSIEASNAWDITFTPSYSFRCDILTLEITVCGNIF
jgi:hypothetical protein